MKLVLLSILQSALAVSGTGLMTMAMHGRMTGPSSLLAGALTPQGLIGMALLLSSFIVMAVILTFAKLSVYIPLNTAISFLLTVVFATLLEQERITIPMVLGMLLIVIGTALVASGQMTMRITE